MAFTLSAKSVSPCAFSPTGKWIIPRGTVCLSMVQSTKTFYSCVEAVERLLVDPSIGFRLFITKHLLSIAEGGSNSTSVFHKNLPICLHILIPKTLKPSEFQVHVKWSRRMFLCHWLLQQHYILLISLEDAPSTVYKWRYMTDTGTVFEGLDNGKCLSSLVCSQLDYRQCESDKMMTLFKTHLILETATESHHSTATNESSIQLQYCLVVVCIFPELGEKLAKVRLIKD